MDEFALIDHYFRRLAIQRDDVVFGIGDDAACLTVPTGSQLLVSTDTLVADVHFLSNWDPYDIAYKSVMVNVSDIAAMGGEPCWVSLALTLPTLDTTWLERFSKGVQDALARFNLSLIGGDTTHGPLSITITIHGLVQTGQAVTRQGAKPADLIFVTGSLGAAALAVSFLNQTGIHQDDFNSAMQWLNHPVPRVDFAPIIRQYASACIDISDGLGADLNHICVSSNTAARLNRAAIPIHPLVLKYLGTNALGFAMSGGDDYELCFTVPEKKLAAFKQAIRESDMTANQIGIMEAGSGLWLDNGTGFPEELKPEGYRHF